MLAPAGTSESASLTTLSDTSLGSGSIRSGLSERPHTARARLAHDTSLDAEELQINRWREMSSVEKAKLVTAVATSARQLSLAGIKSRHPAATERERLLRYAVISLGHSLACRAYPEAEALGG
jgi:hypothetical protein